MGVRAKTSFNQRGVSKMDEERRKKIKMFLKGHREALQPES